MPTNEFTINPKVDSVEEFKEIAFDFSNPLEIVREAISNAFDAKATDIKIGFDSIPEQGDYTLRIIIEDNGVGMDRDGLTSFFDLGNSMHREDDDTIGEKGHGTKVYFNSKKIEVVTIKDNMKYNAVMINPRGDLFEHIVPSVEVTAEETSDSSGTKIVVWGYYNNEYDVFTHANLKDYILWFTKFGSVEKEFGINDNNNVSLELKGLDVDDYEKLSFGHVFPNESEKVKDLFDIYLVNAPKWYCKRFCRSGVLKDRPFIKYDAVFYVEGTRVKYGYNPMISHRGYNAPQWAYTVQDRYGIWLCKDFIPIQRKNEWITSKGSEFTKFHAFINCQNLRLTANRGSVDNTPPEILEGLKEVVDEIYNEITESSDWLDMEWLESEADAYNTSEKEEKDFKYRIDKVKKTKVAEYKGIHLVEPQQENGVFAIFMQLCDIEKDLFPFTILDYDTHVGIDIIVKEKNNVTIQSSRLYYVEFKNHLSKKINHSFANIYSIICWDLNTNELSDGDEVTDIAGAIRTLKIVPPADEKDYTRYYLDSLRSEKKIEIFVLSTYLKEKLGIEFVTRTGESII